MKNEGTLMLRFAAGRLVVTMLMTLAAAAACAQPTPAVQSPRVYVLDGGVLGSDPTRYELTVNDVEEVELSIASFLIVHPRGVLMWDAGAVADHERIGPAGVEQRLELPRGGERFIKLAEPLTAQLAAAGFEPSDVTHFSLSHYHWDHTADANLFAGAVWLTSPLERDVMFAAETPGATRSDKFAALADSRTVLLTEPEHDVFGDGTVVIRQAHGHTPGHAVLYVKLANTGGVVLSGELYHYPAERTLDRYPPFDFSVDETRAARAELETFMRRTNSQLWIQHDLAAHRKLRKAPEYYD